MAAIQDARIAIDTITAAAETITAARVRRDDALWRAARQEGMRAPEIHRALGGDVSLSAVRLAIKETDLRRGTSP